MPDDPRARKVCRVAYQGEPGAYSEQAIHVLAGDARAVPCPEFGDVFAALHDGTADGAVVPVENSTAGTVGEVSDLLVAFDGSVIGEAVLDVRHCLLALPEVPLAQLRQARSHPQALRQCARFLAARGLAAVAAQDTAGAARELALSRDRATGVVASAAAARRYQLAVLQHDIQDDPHNATRFLALAPHAATPQLDPHGDKTSIVVELSHVPGALVGCLEPLAHRGWNVTRIDPRPIAGEPWHYRFLLDFEHPLDPAAVSAVLESIARASVACRVLGTYPRARHGTRAPSPPSVPGVPT